MARFSYEHLIPVLHKMAARNPFEEGKTVGGWAWEQLIEKQKQRANGKHNFKQYTDIGGVFSTEKVSALCRQ